MEIKRLKWCTLRLVPAVGVLVLNISLKRPIRIDLEISEISLPGIEQFPLHSKRNKKKFLI